MFHFSVRDLLWLTLVVAVALGWWLRESQFTRWEGAFKSLEYAVQLEGYEVQAGFDSSDTVGLYKRNANGHRIIRQGVMRKD